MRFLIRHITRYVYSRPVFIDPTTIRLRPRTDVTQRLERFSLHVDPAPAGSNECVDIEGSDTSRIWFNGLHDHLTITVDSEVETLLVDPFNFVLPVEAAKLPMDYDPALAAALAPHLHRPSPSAEADALARQVISETGGEAAAFLTTLVRRIREQTSIVVREDGEPMTPAQTLSAKRGACRDVAVLMMDVCRSAGLGARFVSGYKSYESRVEDRHLHAWTEVYLPGAGWRGYDVTEGLAVADRHIAVAAAATPILAAPVSGTFWGAGVTGSIQYEIQINALGA